MTKNNQFTEFHRLDFLKLVRQVTDFCLFGKIKLTAHGSTNQIGSSDTACRIP